MPEFIPWDSQPLDLWAARHAPGKFVDLNGRRTHYRENGAGPPVILLHGFFFDSYLWSANIDALAQHFTVYALDFWGSGYSTREPLDYGYALFAEQLRLFMDALGIPRASLIGQSMGGGTAIRFCVQQRERVDKLVLVDVSGLPNPMPRVAKFFNLPGVGELFMGLKTDAIRKKGLADSFIHDQALLTSRELENITRHHKIQGSTASYMAVLRKQFFDKLGHEIHRLAGMSVPTLIVWGREDKAIPLPVGEEMHRILKGSRMEILDGAGHAANFERAEEFNRLAVDFLSG